ncbi:tRNA pseudouridine(38-40) synthase TruA [Robiginitalea sp. SC105]|uniref:tRNA pseudouridine(38-40) synthase TruA n=1 Tax=Robiginitalea sp. SC105 TaxID=2762332 RepID=UPI00163AD0D6|nr:tRNA pseudouridine(38-40) synthase TruA [Robiginitalea sp. SC105]MBC2839792.1 tRNA pseudouridine(38-40) synthase TruA [Robiginitalea sp. SC105]
MRFFLEFSYLGTAYHGWQRQPNALTVQEVLEGKMATLLGVDTLDLVAAGRTDAGVHARQMFAHFDWDADLPEDFVFRINAFLPEDIAVRNVHRVSEEAHARFDATGRTYEYLLTQEKDPFRRDFACRVQAPLDFDLMNQAAEALIGFGDFKCFSRSNSDVKTFNCDVRHAHWEEREGVWVFTITADRFLRNMVRAVVGTLLEVGRGRLGVADVKTIIKSRDRSEAGVSVPAKGLYLTGITYPNTLFIHGQGNR